MPQPVGVEDCELNDLDKAGLVRSAEFSRIGSAYALEHATKPSTIGIVLSSNPLALLAWFIFSTSFYCNHANIIACSRVGEKFLDWTDEDPLAETIIESVTLYWLTNTIAQSLYPYRQVSVPDCLSFFFLIPIRLVVYTWEYWCP